MKFLPEPAWLGLFSLFFLWLTVLSATTRFQTPLQLAHSGTVSGSQLVVTFTSNCKLVSGASAAINSTSFESLPGEFFTWNWNGIQNAFTVVDARSVITVRNLRLEHTSFFDFRFLLFAYYYTGSSIPPSSYQNMVTNVVVALDPRTDKSTKSKTDSTLCSQLVDVQPDITPTVTHVPSQISFETRWLQDDTDEAVTIQVSISNVTLELHRIVDQVPSCLTHEVENVTTLLASLTSISNEDASVSPEFTWVIYLMGNMTFDSSLVSKQVVVTTHVHLSGARALNVVLDFKLNPTFIQLAYRLGTLAISYVTITNLPVGITQTYPWGLATILFWNFDRPRPASTPLQWWARPLSLAVVWLYHCTIVVPMDEWQMLLMFATTPSANSSSPCMHDDDVVNVINICEATPNGTFLYFGQRTCFYAPTLQGVVLKNTTVTYDTMSTLQYTGFSAFRKPFTTLQCLMASSSLELLGMSINTTLLVINIIIRSSYVLLSSSSLHSAYATQLESETPMLSTQPTIPSYQSIATTQSSRSFAMRDSSVDAKLVSVNETLQFVRNLTWFGDPFSQMVLDLDLASRVVLLPPNTTLTLCFLTIINLAPAPQQEGGRLANFTTLMHFFNFTRWQRPRFVQLSLIGCIIVVPATEIHAWQRFVRFLDGNETEGTSNDNLIPKGMLRALQYHTSYLQVSNTSNDSITIGLGSLLGMNFTNVTITSNQFNQPVRKLPLFEFTDLSDEFSYPPSPPPSSFPPSLSQDALTSSSQPPALPPSLEPPPSASLVSTYDDVVDATMPWWAVFVAVIGGIVLVVFLVLFVWCWCQRHGGSGSWWPRRGKTVADDVIINKEGAVEPMQGPATPQRADNGMHSLTVAPSIDDSPATAQETMVMVVASGGSYEEDESESNRPLTHERGGTKSDEVMASKQAQLSFSQSSRSMPMSDWVSQPPSLVPSDPSDLATPMSLAGSAEDPTLKFASILATVQVDLQDNTIALLDLLGTGSFGSVYKGVWRELVVAIKVVMFPEFPDESQAKQRHHNMMEVALSSSLSHPNVVHTYTHELRRMVVGDPQGVCRWWRLSIVQELCDLGSIDKALKSKMFHVGPKSTPAMEKIMYTLSHVAHAMAYIHSKNIIHGDLTPTNILLKSVNVGSKSNISHESLASFTKSMNMSFDVKVADFGMSHKLNPLQSHVTKLQGTPHYIAPEVASQARLTKAADVYSFGVLMWELYHGKSAAHRFDEVIREMDTSPAAGLSATAEHQWPGTAQVFPFEGVDCPPEYVALTHACLDANYGARPVFQSVIQQLGHCASAMNVHVSDPGLTSKEGCMVVVEEPQELSSFFTFKSSPHVSQ